jgi:hypothetical protein
VTGIPRLTNWDGERVAVATQNAIKNASESEEATSANAGRLGVAARDDLTITALCVAFGSNSWATNRWQGCGPKGKEENSEGGWDLHFESCLCETIVYREDE